MITRPTFLTAATFLAIAAITLRSAHAEVPRERWTAVSGTLIRGSDGKAFSNGAVLVRTHRKTGKVVATAVIESGGHFKTNSFRVDPTVQVVYAEAFELAGCHRKAYPLAVATPNVQLDVKVPAMLASDCVMTNGTARIFLTAVAWDKARANQLDDAKSREKVAQYQQTVRFLAAANPALKPILKGELERLEALARDTPATGVLEAIGISAEGP